MPAKFGVISKAYKAPTLEQMGIAQVRQETLNALRKYATKMRSDTNKIFENFSPPKPKTKTDIGLLRRKPVASITLTVEDPKEAETGVNRPALLDKGTKRHWVAPRNKPRMAWRASYRQKTRPRWIGSRRGGKSGLYRTSKGHWIRGIVPRQYTETIVKRHQKPLSKVLDKAARRGARKAHRQPGAR